MAEAAAVALVEGDGAAAEAAAAAAVESVAVVVLVVGMPNALLTAVVKEEMSELLVLLEMGAVEGNGLAVAPPPSDGNGEGGIVAEAVSKVLVDCAEVATVEAAAKHCLLQIVRHCIAISFGH